MCEHFYIVSLCYKPRAQSACIGTEQESHQETTVSFRGGWSTELSSRVGGKEAGGTDIPARLYLCVFLSPETSTGPLSPAWKKAGLQKCFEKSAV